MKNIVVFIVDDYINIVYNYKVINIKLSNCLGKGLILNKNIFVDEFIKIIKKEKIKIKLFCDNVTIIKNTFYSNSDCFYINNIFNDLGFLKVEFLDIKELFPTEDATFIEINNTYIVINFDSGLFLDLNYFKDIPLIMEYFSKYMNDNIILFGVSKNIPKINIKNKKVYYYDNFENYITESLLRVKKRD